MKSLSLARPHAIMMVGIPGSGKTFFASHFAETFNAPYIDANLIASYITNPEAISSLTELFVAEIAKTKQTFIYEGDTDSRLHRTEFAKWARMHGYQPLLIWVQTDPRTAEDRSVKQKRLTPEEFQRVVRSFSPPHSSESPIVISGRHTYASQARVILNHLSKNRQISTQPTPPSQQPPHRGTSPANGSTRTIQVR